MLSLQVWTFLFLAVAFQGFFLSFLIFINKREQSLSHPFLGIFTAIFSIILLFWVGYWNDFQFKYANFNFVYNPIPFLLGPSIYFYFKSIYKQSLSKKDGVHLIPFALVFLYFLPFYILDESQKSALFQNNNIQDVLWQWNILGYVMYPLHSLSYIIYAYLIYRLTKSNQITTILSDQQAKWLWRMVLMFGLFACFALINFITVRVLLLPIFLDFVLGIIISFFIYGIGYIGFSMHHTKPKKKKYTSSSLKPEDINPLKEKLYQHLESKKPYLQENYKKSDLAKALNIPSHHLSELLNKYLKKSFNDLINSYRIEAAKQLLHQNNLESMTFEAIGYEVGFNSKTTFYTTFKKHTGLSPGAYIKTKV